MRLGDAPDDPQVPRPRGGSRPFAEAVPIRARAAARSGGGTALLDGLAPPWQRMPDPPAEPLDDPPAVRLAPAAAARPAPDRPAPDRPAPDRPTQDRPAQARPTQARSTQAGPARARPTAATVRPVTELSARRPAAAEHRPAVLSARPRVIEEPSILGLSRRTRSRLGSRLFTLFFVAVFALIAVQMVLEILYG